MKILKKTIKMLAIICLVFIVAIFGLRFYNSFSETPSYENDIISDVKQHPISNKWNHSPLRWILSKG